MKIPEGKRNKNIILLDIDENMFELGKKLEDEKHRSSGWDGNLTNRVVDFMLLVGIH